MFFQKLVFVLPKIVQNYHLGNCRSRGSGPEPMEVLNCPCLTSSNISCKHLPGFSFRKMLPQRPPRSNSNPPRNFREPPRSTQEPSRSSEGTRKSSRGAPKSFQGAPKSPLRSSLDVSRSTSANIFAEVLEGLEGDSFSRLFQRAFAETVVSVQKRSSC